MNNKIRLFEMMGKVNKDFINEAGIMQNIKNGIKTYANTISTSADMASGQVDDKAKQIANNQITNKLGSDFRLQTYGDLKQLVNAIQSIKNKTTAGKTIGGALLDQITGLGMAKTLTDVVKTMGSMPDEKKTNTWLDNLNIDDEFSAIVDDRIENNFLLDLASKLNNEPDDKTLELNYDINAKLAEYISNEYDHRTVTGAPRSLVRLARRF